MALFDVLTNKSTMDKPISDTPRQGVDLTTALPDSSGSVMDGISMPRVYTEEEAETSEKERELLAALHPIQTTIMTRYEQARFARKPMELIWLENMLQWRGMFNAEEAAAIARAKERNVYASSVFIKITKTKVTAAYGQILDLILDNDEIPLQIEPAEHQDEDDLQNVGFIAPEDYPGLDPYGYNGDGNTVEPGATTKNMFGAAYNRFKDLLATKKFVKGASPNPKLPTITPAQNAADKMQKIIITQMEEGGFKRELRYALWECTVLGTGILKGPMTYETTEQRWEKGEPDPETGKRPINYVPRKKLRPQSYYVSCWNFYPDPTATRIGNCQYTIEKHLLNDSAMSDLKRVAGFDAKAIDRVLWAGASPRAREYWEQQIRDVNNMYSDNRFEVLEYWGYLDRDMINTFKKAIGEDLLEGADQYQVNVWICHNEILRLVVNPFVPAVIPYYALPYEEHTQQIWGIAIPENMRDAQMLMNGHYRMMVDNLALAGNCVFEVNENYLSPGQDLTMYPGKVIRTNNGAPGQSLFSLSFNNTSQSHMQAFDKARQMADEVSGQPSYSYGGVSTTGANRTASGISMLMGAAAGNIRQVVKQCDEYVIAPMGQAYYNWNMQYNEDSDVEGRVEIVAGGTAALMRREVMSQRLLQFAQAVGANPAIAPQVNWSSWVREFCRSMNLDPDKFLNDPASAMLAAEMMAKAQGGGSGSGQASGAAPSQDAAAGGAQDQTGGGGGQIGAGMPTTPGEAPSGQNIPKA